MDHPLFFAAFGDEMRKIASNGDTASRLVDLAQKHKRDLGIAGLTALGIYGTHKAIKGARQAKEDWQSGRQMRRAHMGRY
jgi:hypothetical protein